ncbi:MAG: hypothetical protein AB7T08_05450 [Hyphomonadaceae bacterium]
MLLAAVALAGCSLQQDVAAVEAAVAQFHERQAAREDVVIYNEADRALRDANSLAEIQNLNDEVRRVLPRCQTAVRDPANWRMNTSTGAGYTVELGYTRQCADGRLIESFTFRRTDGVWRLLTYNARGEPTAGQAGPAQQQRAPAQAPPAPDKPE